MAVSLLPYTRSQLAQLMTAYLLANSPLTTVGSMSAAQAIANATSARIEALYRDAQVLGDQRALQGVYAAFDFSALSPQQAAGVLNINGTPATIVPANTVVSTVGSSGNPAVLFTTSAAVTLLAANPTVALALSQSAGSSSFLAGQAISVLYAYTNTGTPQGTTLISPVSTLSIATAGNVITTSITLPVGATGVNLYVGTSTSAGLLASISQTGSITYSGSASSGVAVTVSGTTLQLTISAVSDGGAPQPLQSYAGQGQTSIIAVQAGSAGNQTSGAVTNIVTPVSGVFSVTNPTATSGGTDLESLASQQQRFRVFKNSLSRGTGAALVTGALGVSGVAKAVAVGRAYLTCYTEQGSAVTDNTTALNKPKGVPAQPLIAPLNVGDGVYFGANRRFTEIYLDVATVGSGLAATWQYLGAAGAWADLSVTLDQTSNGQTSGTVAWSLPTDWGQATVNGTQAFWIRLSVTSSTITAYPTWYQVLTLDPPPGYSYVYVYQSPGASNVLTTLQSVLDSWRAFGVTAIASNCSTQTVDVTLTITPTTYGATQALATTAGAAISNLISGLSIGQSLPISEIYFAVTSLYTGQAVAEVVISAPAADVLPGVGTLLLPGVIAITIAPTASF